MVSLRPARLGINLGHHEHDQAKLKSKNPKKSCPRQQRRKEGRAADPAVKARAAAHLAVVAAEEAAPLSAQEAALPSPEKVRSSCALKSLKTSPVTDSLGFSNTVGITLKNLTLWPMNGSYEALSDQNFDH